MQFNNMHLKRVLLSLVALIVLMTACSSDGTAVATGEVESSTEETAEQTDAMETTEEVDPVIEDTLEEAPADGTSPDAAPAEATREDSFAILTTDGGYSNEAADCVLNALMDVTGSFSLEVDESISQEQFQVLTQMATECQEIDRCKPVTPPASTLTIEEWRQGAADLEPADRNELYSEVGYPPMTIDPAGSYVAVLNTDDGDMRFELAAELSPVTVNSFVNLADDGYFDGLTFHRVLENFMAQGGDPTGQGAGGPGYQFPNECSPGIEFIARGILAMANAGPGTNGSQFFITFNDSSGLPGDQYTIFGRLVDGDDAFSAIEMRDPNSATEPGTVINSIRIETS